MTITLIPKPDKDATHTHTHKLQASITDEHKHKNPQQILPNRIQQYIKKIIYHNQVDFIPGIQEFFNLLKSINVIYLLTN